MIFTLRIAAFLTRNLKAETRNYFLEGWAHRNQRVDSMGWFGKESIKDGIEGRPDDLLAPPGHGQQFSFGESFTRQLDPQG